MTGEIHRVESGVGITLDVEHADIGRLDSCAPFPQSRDAQAVPDLGTRAGKCCHDAELGPEEQCERGGGLGDVDDWDVEQLACIRKYCSVPNAAKTHRQHGGSGPLECGRAQAILNGERDTTNRCARTSALNR